jgi:hypothetical protein
MIKGVPITISKMLNGYQIRVDEECLYYSTKKALLAAIESHFTEARKPKEVKPLTNMELLHKLRPELNLVDEANRILAGSTPVAEEAI